MVHKIRENRSLFCKVKCSVCENEQIIFEKACTKVTCVVCGLELATPTGGKAAIKSPVLDKFA